MFSCIHSAAEWSPTCSWPFSPTFWASSCSCWSSPITTSTPTRAGNCNVHSCPHAAVIIMVAYSLSADRWWCPRTSRLLRLAFGCTQRTSGPTMAQHGSNAHTYTHQHSVHLSPKRIQYTQRKARTTVKISWKQNAQTPPKGLVVCRRFVISSYTCLTLFKGLLFNRWNSNRRMLNDFGGVVWGLIKYVVCLCVFNYVGTD